jgi:hypothetical protein
MEDEPNNHRGRAQEARLPATINGRIDSPGDCDVFSFQCRAGTEIIADVYARRLGSSLDSVLKLSDADGNQLAFNDDHEDKSAGLTTHHADSRLIARIPKTGTYYVYLADAQQKGGVSFSYRLQLGRPSPDFQLRVVPSSINARAGTTVPITVHALRNDAFDGDILVAFSDAPPGFTLDGGWIPAGVNKIRATLTVPNKSIASPIELTLVGQAKIGRNTIIRTAVPADDRMQAFIYRHLVPAESIQVAVTGTARGSSMKVLTTHSVRIPVGGVSRVPVRVSGRSFFGEMQFELSGPPDGIAIETVHRGRGERELVLRCDAREVKPRQRGNLIINVFAAKTGDDSGKGKEQRKKRRILLTALPAIPYEIVPR